MIAEQLKKTILQAAIQGKLTQQLPTDGNAQDLLKEIQKEKNRLIKERKIKKEKSLPPISDKEKPYDLPTGWVWCRLGDVILQNIGGGTPSKQSSEYWGGDIPWASVKDLNCDVLYDTKDKITSLGLTNSSSNLIPAGNVIICTRMGLGKIVINAIDVAINQDLRALYIANNYFVQQYLIYFYKTQEISGSGMTVKGISIDELHALLFPLPPLAEQQRIVERLEELLPKIDVLKGDEVKLDVLQRVFPKRLRASLLQYAVQGKLTEQLETDGNAQDLLKEIQKEKTQLIKEGKIKKEKVFSEITEDELPFDIPKNWCWVRLGNIGIFSSGRTPKNSVLFSKGKHPYFKVSDMNTVGNEKCLSATNSYLSDKYDGKLFPPNTIVFPKNGGAVFTNKKRVLTADSLVDLNTGTYTPFSVLYFDFIYWLFQLVDFTKYYKGTALPTVDNSVVARLVFPIPPFAEQQRIVERLDRLLPLCDSLTPEVLEKKTFEKCDTCV